MLFVKKDGDPEDVEDVKKRPESLLSDIAWFCELYEEDGGPYFLGK
jgi:hypothetical protein